LTNGPTNNLGGNMYPRKYPEKLPKWNIDGIVKCQVCLNSTAIIRKYEMCLWCYRQYKSNEIDNPKWKAFLKRLDKTEAKENAQEDRHA